MSALGVARRQMVDCQILPSGITDARLVAAMLSIPREIFVNPEKRSLAYAEAPLRIAPGRFMTEPAIFAKLAQAAEIEATNKVLLIGAGTGYGAAILAGLSPHVTALEADAGLSAQAGANLAAAGIAGVTLRQGPLEQGATDSAPFDVVVIEGGVEFIPHALVDQLAEGGRLVAILVEGGTCRGTLYRKIGGVFSGLALFDARLPLLPGFARPTGFRF